MEITHLAASLQVDFRHVGRSANAFVDILAKQGVSGIVPLCTPIL